MKFKKLLIEIKNSIRPIRNLFKKYFFEYKKKILRLLLMINLENSN